MRTRRLHRALADGFLTNVLNPKVSLFYLAVFPQFIHHEANGCAAIGSAFALVSIHAALNVGWFSLMIMLFARLSGAARNRSVQRAIKAVAGTVFVGFSLKLATLKTS